MQREDPYEIWLWEGLNLAWWWVELPATVLRLCLLPLRRIASSSHSIRYCLK
jgi:hypothetical protein